MRQVEVRTIDEDIKGVFVDGEYTGFSYTKKDINLMLDDLIATQQRLPSAQRKSIDQLLQELVTKTLARCYSNHPLEGGSVAGQDLATAISLVAKSCKKGWFS